MGIGKTIWLILFCFILLLGAGLKGYGQATTIFLFEDGHSFENDSHNIVSADVSLVVDVDTMAMIKEWDDSLKYCIYKFPIDISKKSVKIFADGYEPLDISHVEKGGKYYLKKKGLLPHVRFVTKYGIPIVCDSVRYVVENDTFLLKLHKFQRKYSPNGDTVVLGQDAYMNQIDDFYSFISDVEGKNVRILVPGYEPYEFEVTSTRSMYPNRKVCTLQEIPSEEHSYEIVGLIISYKNRRSFVKDFSFLLTKYDIDYYKLWYEYVHAKTRENQVSLLNVYEICDYEIGDELYKLQRELHKYFYIPVPAEYPVIVSESTKGAERRGYYCTNWWFDVFVKNKPCMLDVSAPNQSEFVYLPLYVYSGKGGKRILTLNYMNELDAIAQKLTSRGVQWCYVARQDDKFLRISKDLIDIKPINYGRNK